MKFFLPIGMLCNVVDNGIIGNDMMQSINGINDPYLFSLLHHLLVYTKFMTLNFVMTMF